LPDKVKLHDISTMSQIHAARAPTTMPWAAAVLAALYGWVLPMVLWLTPKMDEHPSILIGAGAVWYFLGLTLCSMTRRTTWGVMLWLPLLVLPGLAGLLILIQAGGATTSGPSAAPLEGVAVLLGLILAAVCVLASVCALLLQPVSVPGGGYFAAAIINTVAILFALPMGYANSTGQDIILTVLNKDGTPVAGASVTYERHGYGSGGSSVPAGSGGPLLTDHDGSAVIPSRRMRYETEMTISKPGYRDLLMKLDMQYNEHDKQRNVSLSTRETKGIAQMKVSAGDTVRLSTYLPLATDAPYPSLERKFFRTLKNDDERPDRYLNLETGALSKDQPSDLEFEVCGLYSEAKLLIKGLNGTEVMQIFREISVSDRLPPYEHLFRIAPEKGYQKETIIDHPGSPEPLIYIRSRGGKRYARLSIDYQTGDTPYRVRYTGTIHINPSGSRLLE
jgi:hypothetical protein